MKKCLLLFSAWLICLCSLHAQSRTIKGKVLDGKNDPLAGISITTKGTSQGTTTNEVGDFSLSVPDSVTTLVFSSVNYATQEVSLTGNKGSLTVKLIPNTGALSEVVVVAYGKERKTNVTGSIATVSASYLENKPFSSVDKTLQGAVAGLQSVSASGAPGSATDIRIRGIGSINASAAPLWVIDGVIATTGDISDNANVNAPAANILSSLNPNDIESISVLKDAAATSLYGSKAANGVIIVTTKKGKAGKTLVTASGEAGTTDRAYVPKNVRPMTTVENKLVIREALRNAELATNDAEADSLAVIYFGFKDNVNTNWLDVVTNQGSQQQYNVSLSGGNDKTQVYASGGYFSQAGTVLATYFKRINGSLSIMHKASDRITFTAGINGSNSRHNSQMYSGYYANPLFAAYYMPSWYAPYNADGSPRYGDTTEYSNLAGGYNPVVLAAFDRNKNDQLTIRGYTTGEYRIVNNLKFTSRYSAELLTAESDQYRNPKYGDGAFYYGYGYAAYRKVFDWTWTNLLDYHLDLTRAKDIYANIQLGQEAQKVSNYFLKAENAFYPTNLALSYLASAVVPSIAYALPSETSTASYFASANVNYKDRYIASGSFRRDGSSVFGTNHKWGNFYSAGLSWNINEEAFLKASKVISLLKLRSSYGENGNALGFGYYASVATYVYDVNYGVQPGSRPNNVGNPNLTWERNKAFNIGLDFGLFNNRLGGTVEYYSRKTDGLLAEAQLSRTSGFLSQLQNIGALTNKGIEISLNARPVNSKSFTWDVAFNISHNKNKVTDLYGGRPVAYNYNNYTVGYDLQTYYLKQWAGVDPANGNPLWYTDSTHKTTTSNYNDARYQLKYSAAPKFYGAITNTFTYKGLSLDVQFYFNGVIM